MLIVYCKRFNQIFLNFRRKLMLLALIIDGKRLHHRRSMGTFFPLSLLKISSLGWFLLSNFTGVQWSFDISFLTREIFQFWALFLHSRVLVFLFLSSVCPNTSVLIVICIIYSKLTFISLFLSNRWSADTWYYFMYVWRTYFLFLC